jgi:LPS sulfotransferase NodH
VIISSGRTGSELLVSLLDSHPAIVCESELLRDGRIFPAQFVAARASLAGAGGARAYGWKLLLNHFRNPGGVIRGIGDPDQFPARLTAHGYRLILLVRRNPVQQAMSFLRGESGGYHHRREDGAEFAPLVVDPVKLMASTWILEEETAILTRILDPHPHLRLLYEDDLLDPGCHAVTVDRVCDYIGVDRAPVSSPLVKLAPTGTRDTIANFDEVSELFRHTRYAAYLSDQVPADGG